MAANVQHADAIRLVQNLEEQILKDPDYHMTYSDAAAVLGETPRAMVAISAKLPLGSMQLASTRRRRSSPCIASAKPTAARSIHGRSPVTYGGLMLPPSSREPKRTFGAPKISRTSRVPSTAWGTMPRRFNGRKSSGSGRRAFRRL